MIENEVEYIVLSMKHGTAKKPVYWRAENKGYTTSPFDAGRYSASDIKAHPDYYNSGLEGNVAIPLTDAVMHRLGFRCSFSLDEIKDYLNETREPKEETADMRLNSLGPDTYK